MNIACKYCGDENVVKAGVRKNKNSIVQRYKCNDCGKTFSLTKLRNKSYDVKVILESLSLYNLGYTLEETSKLINRRYKVKTYPQLIHAWLKEYKELCSFRRFRNKNNIKPLSVIYSELFSHEQPYLFKYHKFKIEELINDYFKGLQDYLAGVVKDCPHKIFVSDNVRGSKFRISEAGIKRIEIRKSKTKACKLAKLALKIASSNKERHSIVQDFMLVNDSATIAVEVPVWLFKEEITTDNILSSLVGADKNISGHVDIVQNKFGFIYVLDYKPEASSENVAKVVSQLFIYALALSVRSGVWLRNFRCAWFDSDNYFEFNPNLVVIDYLKKNNVKDRDVWRKYWSDYKKHNRAVRKKGVESVNAEKGNLLVSPKHRVYSKIKSQNLYPNDFKYLTSSSVVNTLTNDCCLKSGSLDQIGILLNANDNARYSVSSLSEIRELACLRNFSNLPFGIDSILFFNFLNNLSSSSDESPEILSILDLCFSNSSDKYSGEYNFTIPENMISFVTPVPINPVNNTVASIINSIYCNSGYNFLYLLCKDLFIFLPSSNASFSVNLDLDTILLNSSKSFCSSNFFIDSSLASSDQFTQGTDLILALNSSDTDKVIDAIYISPLLTNSWNFSNCFNLTANRSFKYSAQLISGCLSNLFFNSSGIDTVNVAIFVPPQSFVNTLEFVEVFKGFGFENCALQNSYQPNFGKRIFGFGNGFFALINRIFDAENNRILDQKYQPNFGSLYCLFSLFHGLKDIILLKEVVYEV
jgi:DNA-directed RNA polymerase subunit RPC12/RpoP